MAKPRVLQIGIDPSVVDFTPYPGQDAASLRRRIEAAVDALRHAGFDVVLCQVPDSPDAAESVIRDRLQEGPFDVVEIGSGLRTSHEYTEIFERAVNVVASGAPGVRFCFNDSPETTVEAVRRSIGG